MWHARLLTLTCFQWHGITGRTLAVGGSALELSPSSRGPEVWWSLTRQDPHMELILREGKDLFDSNPFGHVDKSGVFMKTNRACFMLRLLALLMTPLCRCMDSGQATG